MTRRATFHFLACAALILPISRAPGDQVKEDEKLLTDAKQSTTGEGLCDFFRKQTPADADLKRVPALIAKLSSDDFDEREKATEALMALGPVALPILRKELNHRDLETRTRVRACVEKVESNPTGEWTAAAARLLRERNPKDAVDVLLAYVPWSASDEVENEVMLTLVALGVKDGKADETFVATAKDKSAVRRAAAALVLARGTDEQKKLAKDALKDADALVRFRAAQGLVAAGDKTALPVLYSLLSEAQLSVAERAEDLLQRVAGDSSPTAGLGASDDSRKKCREAWEAWSKKNYEALDLAKIDTTAARSPAALARDAVRRFAEAGCKGDVDKIEKLMDESINVMGIITIARQDLLKQMRDAPKPDKTPTFTNIKSVKLDEIATNSPETKQFRDAFAKEKVEAVSIEITEGGRQETMILVLRMKGGKMMIAGLAPMK